MVNTMPQAPAPESRQATRVRKMSPARIEREERRARLARMNPARKRRHRLRLLLLTLVIAVSLTYVAFPVWYVVMASLDPSNSLGTDGLWPEQVSTQNFRELGADPTFPFWTWLWNSIRVSLLVSAISVLFTTMSAYAFSRFRFRGRRNLMKSIVVVEVFPNVLALVAIFLMIQQTGQVIPLLGLDSTWALIVVYLGGILGGGVWLMKGYIDSIPREIDESAMIDGASMETIFWRILMPLARPMIAVIGVLVFVATYGELLLARVLLQSSDQLTLPVGLWTFVSGQYSQRWGIFAAGALVAALPALVIFYLLQDWLVKGLTQGAVKT